MTLVPSAGMHVASAERGKTGNQRQAQENMQPVPSSGIRATSVMRGESRRVSQVSPDKSELQQASSDKL